MKPMKIMIQKKYQINSGFNRYYTVDRIIIDNDSPIKTEAQLCWYIYRKFGEGRFMCLAFQKGRKSFWNFWTGFLYENGFVRDIGENKEIFKLKKELANVNDYEEREMITEEIDLEREISAEEKKEKWRGPRNLKKSRAGQLNEYMLY
jgi:hypothetical protein